MKSPQLVAGDFVVGSGGFVMVSGTQKVYQDLSVLVRETLGEDRFHPRWGTILGDFIGTPIGQSSEADVRNEINRVIQNYMIMQSAQVRGDVAMSRRPRFRPDEIVSAIDGIDIQQVQDRLNVRVRVSTASGSSIDLVRTVGF